LQLPLELGVLGGRLRLVVVGAQLGHQVGAVPGRVGRQHLRDDQQRVGKLGDRQLLATSLEFTIFGKVYCKFKIFATVYCQFPIFAAVLC